MICQVIGILGLDLSKRTTSALSVVVLAIWLLDVAAFKTNPTFFLRATWSDSEFESSLDLNEDTLVLLFWWYWTSPLRMMTLMSIC